MEIVGIIALEDGDGREVARVNYKAPRAMRERVVHWQNRAYTQNRREGETWVYKAFGDEGVLGGTVGTDADLEPLT